MKDSLKDIPLESLCIKGMLMDDIILKHYKITFTEFDFSIRPWAIMETSL